MCNVVSCEKINALKEAAVRQREEDANARTKKSKNKKDKKGRNCPVPSFISSPMDGEVESLIVNSIQGPEMK